MNSKKFENRLIHETSPYLLQHAHNPVDWYPWGKEAKEKAREEGKPVFLSVGYSACHWCHVMAHESFENEEIASLMNRHFINVKVDREERPDLDEIYMNAVQLITGQGGWPMSVFLTPDGEPFYGGTYYPPENRYGRPGFPQVLESISRHYSQNQAQVVNSVNQLRESLNRISYLNRTEGEINSSIRSNALSKITQNFDKLNGGFGSQPKFPSTMNLSLMLREFIRNGNQEALEMVTLSLTKMARGGLYDQLAGGFHRYSVDERWLVPHFEKMLYDNALLGRLYTEAYQVTGNPKFRTIIEETLAYVMREMTSPEGGFYSTQDADSEGEEGRFFVWDPDEVNEILGVEDGRLFCSYYDVGVAGNFENGKSILNVPNENCEIAKLLNIDENQLDLAIQSSRAKLLAAREKRTKPGLDDKIQVNWNGLMISAFAIAYQALGDPAYLQYAKRSTEFISNRMVSDDGRLSHIFQSNEARFNGYQDDYAFLICSLIDLFESSFELDWLNRAANLMEIMLDQFWDGENGAFFYTSNDHEDLIVRSKSPYDNAIPSGNAMAAMGLMRLGSILDRKDYWEKAESILRLFQPMMNEMPSGFGQMIAALDFYIERPEEIAILGAPDAPETGELLNVINRNWRPNRTVVVCDLSTDNEMRSRIPLFEGKVAVDGKSTVYVCRNFACSAPQTEPAGLELLLQNA